MTVDEAVDVLRGRSRCLARRLQVLQEVGLGYLRLGQPATTLSGGEAQRLKIAAELGARLATTSSTSSTSRPPGSTWTTCGKLLGVLNRLVDAGNTVLVVEHHLDVIKCADWVMDLGPEGGDAGGELVAEGTPEQVVAQVAASYTGKFLRDFLKDGRASERPARGGPEADAPPAAAASEPGAGSTESEGSLRYYGWIVVGAAFTVLFIAYGAQYSFGVFFTALTEEFGWSRGAACPASSPSTPAAYSFLGLVCRPAHRPLGTAGGHRARRRLPRPRARAVGRHPGARAPLRRRISWRPSA